MHETAGIMTNPADLEPSGVFCNLPDRDPWQGEIIGPRTDMQRVFRCAISKATQEIICFPAAVAGQEPDLTVMTVFHRSLSDCGQRPEKADVHLLHFSFSPVPHEPVYAAYLYDIISGRTVKAAAHPLVGVGVIHPEFGSDGSDELVEAGRWSERGIRADRVAKGRKPELGGQKCDCRAEHDLTSGKHGYTPGLGKHEQTIASCGSTSIAKNVYDSDFRGFL